MDYKIFFKKNSFKFFLIFLVFLSYYRSPFIFTDGRFVGLDLIYHLISSDLSFLASLTYVDIGARYINLISNIASLISSRLFELEYAQYVSVYLSFFVYLIVFYLILFKESYFFEENYQKYLGALIVLVSPVMNFEIWLNIINLQVYLGILTLVILFLKDNNKNILFYSILIFVAGLSGIYSCIFTPLFFLKFINKKNYFNLICFLIIFFCTLIQLFIIYNTTKVFSIGETNTSLVLTFNTFEAISYAYNVIIRSFFGSSLPIYLAGLLEIDLVTIFNSEYLKNILFSFSLLIFIILIIFFIFCTINIKDLKDKIIYLTLLSLFFLISLVVVIGGVSDSLHGRYAALTGTVLIFSLLHLSRVSNFIFIKNLSMIMIILTITFGFFDFRYKKYINYLDCINCPDWNEEVKKYKLDNNYKMNAWPYHIDR
jgi:hypothetical protein